MESLLNAIGLSSCICPTSVIFSLSSIPYPLCFLLSSFLEESICCTILYSYVQLQKSLERYFYKTKRGKLEILILMKACVERIISYFLFSSSFFATEFYNFVKFPKKTTSSR